MTKLHRVAEGNYLHYPFEVDADGELWLGPGGVLDMEDPYVRHAVKGQEYKLEPAPAGSVAAPITHTRMALLRDQFLGRAAAVPTDEESAREEGAERLDAEGGTGEIQKARVDRPTKKRAPVAQKAESA